LALAGTLTQGGSFLHLPGSLDSMMSTSDTKLAAANPRVRRRVRMVRENGLRPRLSTSPDDFERFYDDFHLPMVRERFGPLGVRQPRRVLRRRFRFGGLIWVERDGEPFSADLFETRGQQLTALVHGRRPGLDPATASLVHHATYLFAFEHAAKLGLERFNMGGAVPVLSDGVLRHKRSWGASVLPRAETHVALLVGWRRPVPAVARLLSECPLVVKDPAGLSAVAAVADDRPADPREGARIFRSLVPPGVRRMILAAASGWAPVPTGVAMPPGDRLRLDRLGSSADLQALLARG
ncbi:MAG: GNAT family N-acetyltransferase, partial [Geminicoccaceae bacterium]|nr:GNAT family N-acetyltransferase [Geminicoccaceae bacterium]